MSAARFQPEVLVRDNNSRVGKVVGDPFTREINGNPVEVVAVDYWGEEQRRPTSLLTLLDSDSPEALLCDRPEQLVPWAEEAPLKLVALALSVGGGKGKAADIREKLSGRVIEEQQWDNWWKKHSRSLGSLPNYFESIKAAKGNDYRLLTSVEAVPSDGAAPAKSKTVPMKVWREWLQSGAPGTSPGRYPTKPVAEALAKWDDAGSISDVLIRLESSAEALLARNNVTTTEAEGWLTAIAHAAIRRREIGGPDPRGYDAARAGEVLARLVRIAGDRTPQDLVLEAGALDGETDAWRRGFVAGLWEAFEGDDAREMYRTSSAVLGRQARADLARQIALAAFDPGYSARRDSELDRLLDLLPEDQRTQLLQEVIASATPRQKDGVLDYIANSRHASGPELLGLRTMAALALGDERSDFAAQTSRDLAEAMEAPEGYVGPVKVVLKDAAIKAGEAKSSGQLEVKDLVEAHQAKLQQERQEQERLRQQVQALGAELDAQREESRLEIRQDMLLAVGEVLQSVYRRGSVEELAGDVEAGLTLALRAGGAELLEKPGEMVRYNPQRHQAKDDLPESAMVQVIAPGVIVRGGVHGDRVLLKAHVKHEAG